MSGPAETPTGRVAGLLERVVAAYGLEATVEVAQDDEQITGTVEGAELGLLIGRHGQTIDAIQHLASRIAFRDDPERKRVVIDAEGYRARREESLHRQADRAVSEATRYDRPAALDEMGPAERRIVHEYLRDNAEVETHSEGDEPHRHLVVTLAAH